MAKTVKAQLKCRHDTAANWTAKNPVLLDGELGVETDTTFFKIGDGATAWTSLKYVTSKSAKAVPWSGVTGKPGFATVATSGSYNDLKNKPTTIENANVAAKTVATAAVDGTADVFRATMASNDAARIRVGGATNAGWMEIATGDDATEPIYVRQYQCNGSGTGDDTFFKTLVRTATLLDGSGNTAFPGTVTANGFIGNVIGDLTGTASKATADASGNNIANTYATKDYVTKAIKEALAAATITYDGKVTYKG